MIKILTDETPDGSKVLFNAESMINIILHDDENNEIMTLPILLLEEQITVEKAIINACKEYLETAKGWDLYINNKKPVEWIDFAQNVPNTICAKHGFLKITGTYRRISELHFSTNMPLYTKEEHVERLAEKIRNMTPTQLNALEDQIDKMIIA